ncbi:TetR/AcrR family transcriptional regulator [Comamonas thiooxydans]|uniref:TetR/AcrR family transcriptional regulator n=1 Tax=Comamonas thiooxydans TaxID=363952 RepID=UPI00242E2D2A|nr:TetR/AcrR family transcriptional regulator [Comamonas thiooxydans]MDH1254281.1 TetR/AcrR family transcriptional regulator [Comamonas thiooxydans]
MKKASAAPRTRASRSDAQRQTILDAASLLFIEKGFGGTNINDIADAVGMTRTALYYYFPSKESMLEALTREVTERAGELTKEVAQRAELAPDESLRQLIVQHAGLVLSHPLQFRIAERSEGSLPEDQRLAAQAARRAVRKDFVDIIRRGIDQGVFRPVDADVAAFSILGMCNWCAWWFDSRRGESADTVVETIASLGLHMLLPQGYEASPKKRRTPSRATKEEDIGAALARMRDALESLENSLEDRK